MGELDACFFRKSILPVLLILCYNYKMTLPIWLQIALTVLLAAIPALIWGLIFYQKDPVYKPRALLTFFLGILSVIPILAYKWSWQYFPQINVFAYTEELQTNVLSLTPALTLTLGTLLAFLFVGFIEEIMKNFAVRKADQGFFRNVDDAIEFSILAALGFSFLENILYFYTIWKFQGSDTLLISFVFRGVFSTFAHVRFSGIYGYFYGLAYFAEPVWSEEQRKKRHPWISAFHRLVHSKDSQVFAREKLTEGLLLAATLHALFNILLELQLTFFMVPFLVIGYAVLTYLFKKKENLKEYGCLLGEKSSPACAQKEVT